MLSILVQSRELAPRLNRARLQRTPRVVQSTSDTKPQRERLPKRAVGLATAAEAAPRISAGVPFSIGSLLYGSVGLIAAGVVAVFFGTGFSLLVPTGGGTMSGSANRAGPEARSPLPSFGDIEQQTFISRVSARENEDTALNSAAFPAPTEAPIIIDGKDGVPHLHGLSASKPPTDTSKAPANAPIVAPASAAAFAPAPAASSRREWPSCWTMATLFCAMAMSLRHACSTSARRVPVTRGQHCASEPPSIRNFSAASVLASCKPIQQRPNLGTAVLADLGMVDAKRQINSFSRQDRGK